MNKKRMKILAEALEDRSKREELGFSFNMSTILMARLSTKPECGTVGCVAGLAVLLFDEGKTKPENVYCEHATELLDLNGDGDVALFDPREYEAINEKIVVLPFLDHSFYSTRNAAKAVRLMASGSRNPWREIWENPKTRNG